MPIAITAVSATIPITPATSRRMRADQPSTVHLEISSDNLQFWDMITGQCGEIYQFEPDQNFGFKYVGELPYFEEIFRYLAGQQVVNRNNPLGEFIGPAMTAMEAALAAKSGSCVYFAQADDRVKVGWSRKIATRMAQLQTGNAAPIQLLGFTPGGRTKERQIHQQFAHLRVAGEWFQAERELLAYIETVCRRVEVHS